MATVPALRSSVACRTIARRLVPMLAIAVALQVSSLLASQAWGQTAAPTSETPAQGTTQGQGATQGQPQGQVPAVSPPEVPVAQQPAPVAGAPQPAASDAPAGSVTDGTAPAAPQPISPDAQQSAVPEAAGSSLPGTELLPDLPSLTPPEGEGGLHDLSPWGMFLQADIVVKAVMLGLVFASLVTWTVWVAKSLELFVARRRVRAGHEIVKRSQTLNEAEAAFRVGRGGSGTVAQFVRGALDEAQRSGDLPAGGIKERAEILLSRIEARAGRRMSVGTGVLATIGSTAPFVGLFGTVWGIMNSFIGIAKSNTTNLAVVAPGIAEALLATAIGLVAAIPAVIVYNVFARSISGYKALLGDASAEVLRHLSRDLDRNAANRHRNGQAGGGHVAPLRSAAE
ncbi:biopolymer transport protein ExbB [Pseudochelatococcus lubricantis]|uniref:Biopolymer transport protein ExbB n=1 Tax=Pseudochelatococcus lubricantis TaxID=1538102 RepID=A0ABX0UWX0_9HYPH|nr:tonB-system energizer ExbB [Pseudochelatococcus lubricantis]NIJ56774.1 biopolymer transport protein ExbB [Pseudochelatococcus lubricantis]